MSTKPERMYSKGRSLGKDSQGKPTVVDTDKAGGLKEGTGGEARAKPVMDEPGEGDVLARHAHERHQLFAKHESEQRAVDEAGNTEKGELHARHVSEVKALHKKHEKELSGSKK